jgi:hypothetical protein
MSPDGKLFVYSLNEKAQYSLWLGQTSGESAPILLRPLADTFYASLSFLSTVTASITFRREFASGKESLYRSACAWRRPEKLRENVPAWIAFRPGRRTICLRAQRPGTGQIDDRDRRRERRDR